MIAEWRIDSRDNIFCITLWTVSFHKVLKKQLTVAFYYNPKTLHEGKFQNCVSHKRGSS